jgi:hypothetical protein
MGAVPLLRSFPKPTERIESLRQTLHFRVLLDDVLEAPGLQPFCRNLVLYSKVASPVPVLPAQPRAAVPALGAPRGARHR